MDKIKDEEEKTFEKIKHIDENGIEYWYARKLQTVLQYTRWEKFLNVIQKAKRACENSGYTIDEHFHQVGKTIKMPKNAEKIIIDYKLTRYACYCVP
jgi:DNA-damage-inducible protein D